MSGSQTNDCAEAKLKMPKYNLSRLNMSMPESGKCHKREIQQ